MITLTAVQPTDGRLTFLIGLTDVNVERLRKGEPIAIDASTLPGQIDADLVVFHATRESCVTLARGLGMDEREVLDALGEG